MNKKLAIYGPYPPPIGGVSVHIKRMVPYLDEANIDYTIFNFGFKNTKNVVATKKSIFWYPKIFLSKKYELFHFHQIFFFEYFFYFLFSFVYGRKIILSIHAERVLFYSSIKKKIVLFLLKNTQKLQVVSVSKNLDDFFISKNINSVFLPAYVPPSSISCEIIEKDNRTYFLFSVWKLTKKLSEETYNIPLAFQFLKNHKDKFKMILMIGSEGISDLDYLRKLINEYSIENDVEIIFDKNLVDYLQNGSFLLKTNKVDGYGVALQEAMDLGIPAIATDVCIRPKGTVLFKDNDINDLTNKINDTLNKPTQDILKDKEDLKYHLKLIEIYKQSLN